MTDNALYMFILILLATLSSSLGLFASGVLYGVLGFTAGVILWFTCWQWWLYIYPDLPYLGYLFFMFGIISLIMGCYFGFKSLGGKNK